MVSWLPGLSSTTRIRSDPRSCRTESFVHSVSSTHYRDRLLALHLHDTPMVRDDSVRDREPKARSLPLPLRGREGVEDVVQDPRRNPFPAVLPPQEGGGMTREPGVCCSESPDVPDGGEGYVQHAAGFPRGVGCIGTEVQDHLPDPGGVGQDHPGDGASPLGIRMEAESAARTSGRTRFTGSSMERSRLNGSSFGWVVSIRKPGFWK